MLSVAESAEQLGVSPARVRALIKDGRLPAVKNGREWVLREEDVLQRLMEHPRAGRPRGCAAGMGGGRKREGPGKSISSRNGDCSLDGGTRLIGRCPGSWAGDSFPRPRTIR